MGRIRKYGIRFAPVLAAASLLGWPQGGLAQDNPFESGWILNPEASALRFQSIKNTTKVESSEFAKFTGLIDENGVATLRVLLDSVDTKVDLRNLRMRFLFFETFLHPEAIVTLRITPEMVADLPKLRRKVVTVPYSMSLHGMTRDQEAEIAVTLLDNDTVSIGSTMPISIPVADFELSGGLAKLQEAANVVIVPSATVSFELMFSRDIDGESILMVSTDPEVPANAATETAGNFAEEACRARFDVLSRTGNITFAPSSAFLQDSSVPILDNIADIVRRCPDLNIEIAGHTDADGGAVLNQVLSEKRAESVRQYLVNKGIDGGRILALGYGETAPLVPNDTTENKRRNRRIEFSVLDL